MITERDGGSTEPIPTVPGASTPAAMPALDVYATVILVAMEGRMHGSERAAKGRRSRGLRGSPWTRSGRWAPPPSSP
jgi:hypothetical protein